MSETVAVVKPYYLTEEAYSMAYNRFKPYEDTDADTAFENLDGFRQSAEYANTVLPKLRAMAGFADNGHGTYQINRQVAAIDAGCEEDDPAEAELLDASHVFDRLVDAWTTGCIDGATGDSYDPNSVRF